MLDRELLYKDFKDARKNRMDQFSLNILKLMLEKNIKWFSAHYIRNRTTEIVEKTLDKLKFKSETIKKARKAFLDVLVDGIDTYTWEDERKGLKKDLKDKEKKKKAKERLFVIERLQKGLTNDSTEERDLECEPICQEIAKMLLSKENIVDNVDFIEKQIEIHNEDLMLIPALLSLEDVFNLLYDSLDQSYKRANEIKWGCDRDKIKLRQIDNILKNGNTNSDS